MKYILALTPLWVGHVVSIPAPQGQVPTDWTTKKCSDPFINDAAAPAAARWNASAAAHAWNAIEVRWYASPQTCGVWEASSRCPHRVDLTSAILPRSDSNIEYFQLAWNQEAPPPGDTALNLSAYVGNFFHTKDRLSCENAADNPCDDTILCSDVTPAYPAGYVTVIWLRCVYMLNVPLKIHDRQLYGGSPLGTYIHPCCTHHVSNFISQIHKTVYDSLTPALALMQSHISTFQGTFAPSIPDNEAIIKEILDVFALLFAVSSAFVWNVGKHFYLLLKHNHWLGLVAKEAAWFSDDNYRGFSKDSANALIALGINSGKDNLPSRYIRSRHLFEDSN